MHQALALDVIRAFRATMKVRMTLSPTAAYIAIARRRELVA